MSPDNKRILIAGGGPVGLLCAWLLGKRGLPVRVVDDNDEPQNDPRAATTHPATLELLSEDGLAEAMHRVRRGFKFRGGGIIGRAEDHPRMTARAVGDDDC